MRLMGARQGAVLGSILVSLACAGGTAPPAAPPEGGPEQPTPPPAANPNGTRIVFDRAALELRQGGSMRVAAKVVDANGHDVPGVVVTFSSAGDSAATVASDGTVSGVGPGVALLRASAAGAKDSLAVDVIGHPEGLYIGSTALADRPYGVAVSRRGTVLVTRLDANVLAVADAASRAIVGSVGVGRVPTGVAFDSQGRYAYVTNQFDSSVGIVDAENGRQVAAVAISGNPYVVKVSPDDRKLYVSSNTDYVRVIDLGQRAVTHSVPVGYAPNGFAIDPDETRLYVSSFVAGTVTEIDLRTDQVLRTFTTGGRPQDLIVSKDGRELYVANEDGWIDVYTLATGERAASVALAAGGFGMALSPDEAHLYVSLPDAGQVQVVNTHSRNVIHTIAVGGRPRRIAFTYHGGVAVVANENGKVDFVR